MSDWTAGPAKWAAAMALGTLGVGGLAYAIIKNVPPRLPAPATNLSIHGERPRPLSTPTGVPANDPSEGSPSSGAERAQTTRATPTTTGFAQTIRINRATAEELDLLPGIGPAKAAAIIESREQDGPFTSVKDLERVSGIGPKTAEQIGPYLSFE